MIFEPSNTIEQILEGSLLGIFYNDMKKVGTFNVTFLNNELKEIDYWDFRWKAEYAPRYADNYDCLIFNLDKLDKSLKIKEIKTHINNNEKYGKYEIVFYLDENIEQIILHNNGYYSFSKNRVHIKRFDKSVAIEEILKDDLLNRENRILNNNDRFTIDFFDDNEEHFSWWFPYREYCGAYGCYKNLLECINDHLQLVKNLKVKRIEYVSKDYLFIVLDEDIKTLDKELSKIPTITQPLKISMSKSIDITFDCKIRIKEEKDIERIKKELSKHINDIVEKMQLYDDDNVVSMENIEILS